MKSLSSYLIENEISQSAFAKRIGVSRSYISEILNGVKAPSLSVAVEIEDATKGQVEARSLRLDPPPSGASPSPPKSATA